MWATDPGGGSRPASTRGRSSSSGHPSGGTGAGRSSEPQRAPTRTRMPSWTSGSSTSTTRSSSGGSSAGYQPRNDAARSIANRAWDYITRQAGASEREGGTISYTRENSDATTISPKGGTNTSPLATIGRVGAPVNQLMAEKVKQQEETAARNRDERNIREKILNTNEVDQSQMVGAKGAKRFANKGKRMTWKEYNALTETQRAAVDFNTMLTQAVKKDYRLQDEYAEDDEGQKKYDDAWESMFGSDGGSVMEAPETVALLKKIKFKDESADLDDFLTLSSVITDKDLKGLALSEVPRIPQPADVFTTNPITVNRPEVMSKLATSTQRMEQSLARTTNLMQSITATAALDRNEILQSIGGIENVARPTLGYGPADYLEEGEPGWAGDPTEPADVNTYLQGAFERIANKGMSATMERAEGYLDAAKLDLNDAEFNALMSFADTRTGNAERFNIPLGVSTDERVKYRTPRQARRVFGLRGGIGNG